MIEEIVSQYESRISGFFHGKVDSPEDMEDLVQETVCRIMQSFPRFRSGSSVGTWIYGICGNVLKEYYSRKERGRDLLKRIEISMEEDPISNAAEADFLIGRLPSEYQLLYVFHYRRDYSVSELSALYGIPVGTVKYRLYVLRKYLRLLAERFMV